MARKTSFSHQKEVLTQFLQLLSSFEGELSGAINKYEISLDSLYEEEGLMDEIYADYRDAYLLPLKSELEKLSQQISTQDIPFVEKEIDFISSR